MKSSFRANACIPVLAASVICSFSSVVYAQSSFESCKEFRRQYPSGIAKSRVSLSGTNLNTRKIIVSRKLYLKFSKLDTDKDGLICERGQPRPPADHVFQTEPPTDSSSVNQTSTTLFLPDFGKLVATHRGFAEESVPVEATVIGYSYAQPASGGANVPSREFSVEPPVRSNSTFPVCGRANTTSISMRSTIDAIFPCDERDNVLVKYSGKISSKNLGTRQVAFSLVVDDGAHLVIDDVPVISVWREGGSRRISKQIELDLGIEHSFELFYYENQGLGEIRFLWRADQTQGFTSPGTTVKNNPRTTVASTVPQVNLTSTSTSFLVTTTAAPCTPRSSDLSWLDEKARSWKVYSNRDVFSSVLRYEGSSAMVPIWTKIFDLNQRIYGDAKQAIQSCKSPAYVFDNFDVIQRKAQNRTLTAADSIAFVIVP